MFSQAEHPYIYIVLMQHLSGDIIEETSECSKEYESGSYSLLEQEGKQNTSLETHNKQKDFGRTKLTTKHRDICSINYNNKRITRDHNICPKRT